MEKIVLFLLIFIFLAVPILSQNQKKAEVTLTREVPETKDAYFLNAYTLNSGESVIASDRMMPVGESRFFSVFFYVKTISGTPNIDAFLLSSFDDNKNHLSVDISGTYQILDDSTRNDYWFYTYVSPSPCDYTTIKIVCNSGSCQVTCVFYKTGS